MGRTLGKDACQTPALEEADEGAHQGCRALAHIAEDEHLRTMKIQL